LVKLLRNSATIKYTERVYKPGAETFEHFKETEETQLMPYPVTCLDESHEIWSKALGHTNAVAYVAKQKIQAMVTESIEIVDDDEFDLTDIENLYANEGKGSHLLEMDFSPDSVHSIPYTKKNGEASEYWYWSHKLTKYPCKRFKSATGKSFDTGKLSKYLITLRTNPSIHQLASARAKKILSFYDRKDEQVVEGVASTKLTLSRKELLLQQVRYQMLKLHY
jgi:hypothetical protein